MVVAALLLAAQADTLDAIVADREALNKEKFEVQVEKNPALNERVLKLIEAEKVTEAADFARAANAIRSFSTDYEVARIQYELNYTAVALGDEGARKIIAGTWNALTFSLGRDITLMESPMSRLSPVVIREVLQALKPLPEAAQDNAEVAQMFKEDQEARQGEFTQEKIKAMMEGDAKRMTRIKEIIAEGKLATGNDFYYAAFLYQHGSKFDDFHLAHELSLCAIFRGHAKAKWIGAASYDRMLANCGHRQRWATQYSIVAGKTILRPVDTTGISEVQRKKVVGVTLEEARNRKF